MQRWEVSLVASRRYGLRFAGLALWTLLGAVIFVRSSSSRHAAPTHPHDGLPTLHAFAVVVGGYGGSTTTDRGGPTISAPDAAVRAFAVKCTNSIADFRSGRIDYPRTLHLRMGGASSYQAAIDIRTVAAPPQL